MNFQIDGRTLVDQVQVIDHLLLVVVAGTAVVAGAAVHSKGVGFLDDTALVCDFVCGSL